jgi:hypothetical protein
VTDADATADAVAEDHGVTDRAHSDGEDHQLKRKKRKLRLQTKSPSSR